MHSWAVNAATVNLILVILHFIHCTDSAWRMPWIYGNIQIPSPQNTLCLLIGAVNMNASTQAYIIIDISIILFLLLIVKDNQSPIAGNKQSHSLNANSTVSYLGLLMAVCIIPKNAFMPWTINVLDWINLSTHFHTLDYYWLTDTQSSNQRTSI